MDISDIVQVNVTTLTAAVKQDGFGIPLIADYHTRFAERVRLYSDLDGMLDDGFLVTDAAYKAAAAAFAQNPQLDQLAIGRRALAPSTEIRLYPTAVNSAVYALNVVQPDGTVSPISFTADSSATVAEVVAGLAAAIDALAGVAAVAGGSNTYVAITASAGQHFSVHGYDRTKVRVQQLHADPGIATDLANIKLENNDWYGVTLTSQGKAEILAACAWVESNKKLGFFGTQDGDVLTATADNVADAARDSSYNRSHIFYHPDNDEFQGAALFGASFPLDPGSLTFAYRNLAGVASTEFTATEVSNLKSQNAGFYATYGSRALTREGKVASGEWIDIIRDRDWYESLLTTYVFDVLANNPKVPFTDAGIALIEAAVRRATREAINSGFLAEGSDEYIIPAALDVSSVDRAARRLKTIKVNARVAGAIHLVEINATITV